MQKNVLKLLKEQIENFTYAQRKVGDYILKNPTEVAFLTVEQLAGLTKVSVATIMRVAYALQYTGYSQFEKDLQELLRDKIAPSKRLEQNLEKIGCNKILLECTAVQIKNINKTVEFLSDETIEKTVALLNAAQNIYVIGIRTSYPMAHYLSDGLVRLGIKCELLLPESVRMQVLISNLTTNDLVLAISLPRYAKQAVEVCRVAREKGARIVAITDGYASPLAALADTVLSCAFESLSFQHSQIGVMLLVEYLITEMGIKRAAESKRNLEELEKVMLKLGSNLL
ncbi:MAG: MurR/RpiR family transcriptional regulator [Sporomusa sp.]